jgi:hypothetical protein
MMGGSLPLSHIMLHDAIPSSQSTLVPGTSADSDRTFFQLSVELSEDFEDNILTYANANVFSRKIYKQRLREYERRLVDYFSICTEQQHGMYVSFFKFCGGFYSPSTDQRSVMNLLAFSLSASIICKQRCCSMGSSFLPVAQIPTACSTLFFPRPLNRSTIQTVIFFIVSDFNIFCLNNNKCTFAKIN